MRLCSASCDARSSSFSIGICCSSATGLWSSSRHSTGSSSRNRLVVSSSQLHQRFCASADSRWCAGATNCPSVRASLTIGASCAPGHHQHPHVVGVEGARLDGLHDQHALQQPAIDDRHAEERAVRVLAGLAEVLEARMRRRVGDDLRPQLLGDQAGQALGQPHADAADALRPQADRRRQHQVGAIGLEQVDRADVGLEPLLNQVDDVGQRLGGLPLSRDQPADLFERPEQRPFVAWCRVADRHHASVGS